MEKKSLKYEKVKEELRAMLDRMRHNEKLQTMKELQKRFSASQATIVHALEDLKEEGLVRSTRGSGIFAVKPDRRGFSITGIAKIPVFLWRLKPDMPYKEDMLTAERELDSEFERKNTDVELKIDYYPPGRISLHKEFIVKTASGEGPSCFLTSGTELGTYKESSFCADITPYLTDWPDKNDIWPELWKQCIIDGKLYGIPGTLNKFMLHYNKEHFRKAGLNPDKNPESWDELKLCMEKLSSAKPAMKIMALPTLNRMTWLAITMLYLAGNRIFRSSENTITPLFSEENGVRTFQLLKDLIWKYNAIICESFYQGVDEFIGEKSCSFIEGTKIPFHIANRREDADRFGIASLPPENLSTGMAQVSQQVWLVNGNMSDSETEATCRYLKFRMGFETTRKYVELCKKHGTLPPPDFVYKPMSSVFGKDAYPPEIIKTIDYSIGISRIEPSCLRWDKNVLSPVLSSIASSPLTDIPGILKMCAAELSGRTESGDDSTNVSLNSLF